MKNKAEFWQTYRETTKIRVNNLKPGNFCPRESEMGMEYVKFFNILSLMARQDIWFSKKLCNYEEGPCVE
jgi:hypothetical protein